MGDLIQLDEHREQWLAALCACGDCGALWAGVVHLESTHHLECPRCGKMAGTPVPIHIISVDDLADMRDDPYFANRFADKADGSEGVKHPAPESSDFGPCEVCGLRSASNQVVNTPLDGFLYFCAAHRYEREG